MGSHQIEGNEMKLAIKLNGLDSKVLLKIIDKNGWAFEWISFELAYKQMKRNEEKMDKWMREEEARLQ